MRKDYGTDWQCEDCTVMQFACENNCMQIADMLTVNLDLRCETCIWKNTCESPNDFWGQSCIARCHAECEDPAETLENAIALYRLAESLA